MKGAEFFVRCLENEGVEYLFGLPGEENIAGATMDDAEPLKVQAAQAPEAPASLVLC